MELGYVGIGHMGGAIARRLLRDHTILVYDRDQVAVQRMADLGAKPCANLTEIAIRCDTILLCLPTSAEVRTVILGGNGLADAARSGTLIVDQTTGDPAVTRALGAELAIRNVELIDAPVSGGPQGADDGTLAIMVGSTPAQFARIAPALRSISPHLFHAGGLGAGHVAKLANNMISAAQRAITLEAVALAAKNGVAPAIAVEIMLAGSGRNYYMEHHMRSQVLSGKLDSGFPLHALHKDVLLATQIGVESGVPMFVGNMVKEFVQLCIASLGRDAEVNAAALVMDRLAGTRMVPAP